MTSYFNVAHIKLATKVEGPFTRCCIWFQGCNLHCAGCINEDLQGLKVRHIVSLEKLLEIIQVAKEKYNIEGVTLSGGEPLLQQDLYVLCNGIRDLGLGIILFTGFTSDKLPENIKSQIDMALCGPYISNKHDNERFLLGSTNKQIVEFSSRYHDHLSYFLIKNQNIIGEWCLDDDYIFMNGD